MPMTIIVKQVYWYISGERLQDHWSSSCIIMLDILNKKVKENVFESL